MHTAADPHQSRLSTRVRAGVQGHQHSVLSRIAAVGTRTSATSSDFAQPKARNVTVGSTS
eukprot:scaffold122670_cov36-Phaeocystis_antarctica.AAC.1